MAQEFERGLTTGIDPRDAELIKRLEKAQARLEDVARGKPADKALDVSGI